MSARSSFGGQTIARWLFIVSNAASCAGDGTGPGPGPSVPTTLAATSPTTFAAPVASSAIVSVRVTDATGAGVRDVIVSFAVSGGNGSVVSPATTDAAGMASTTWMLGTAAGPNQLTAAVPGLEPVRFDVTARAGAAVTLEVHAGDDQTGEAKWPLPQLLSVRLTDAYQNPVADVPVTFAVTAGSGTISGAYTTTNGAGVATSGPWTLGASGEAQSVTAYVASVPTVTINATVEACTLVASIAVGTPIAGTLESGDCQLSGEPTDRYDLTTEEGAVAIALESSAFAPWVTIASASSLPIASSLIDPATPIVLITAATSRSVTVRSAGAAQTGNYTLTVRDTSASITDCRTVFIEHGATTSQALSTSDCNLELGAGQFHYIDRLRVYMEIGAELFVEMSATAFVPFINMYSIAGVPLKGCSNAVAVSCRYIVPATGYYTLWITSGETDQVGEYTLTVH